MVTISLALNVSSQEIRHELDTMFALEGSLARLRGQTYITAVAGKARKSLGAGDRRVEFYFQLCFEPDVWPWTSPVPSLGLCAFVLEELNLMQSVEPSCFVVLGSYDFFFSNMVLLPQFLSFEACAASTGRCVNSAC